MREAAPKPTTSEAPPFARDDGGGVDIGAYERQTVATLPSTIVVTTLDDELDANPLGDLDDLSVFAKPWDWPTAASAPTRSRSLRR